MGACASAGADPPQKRIALVCTSTSEWKGGKTGVWLEEYACPYYIFKEAGFEVIMVSIKGGEPPVDPKSLEGDFYTEHAKKFVEDAEAQTAFKSTLNIDAVDPNNFDGVFLAGGHGTIVDFVGNASLKSFIEAMFAADKPIGAVCHGPVGLFDAKKDGGNSPLVADKRCTCFSDAEEDAVKQTENHRAQVGFLCEAKIKELGGKFVGAAPWSAHCVTDGNLVTGMNPQSSPCTAKAFVELFLPKIALVCTSTSEWKGGKTGVWLEEYACPYYTFKEAGLSVTMVSVKGGEPPVDPGSRKSSPTGEDHYTEHAKKFDNDAQAQDAFKNTLKIDAVDPTNFAGVFLAGGHGTIVDFVGNAPLKAFIEAMFAANKPIGAVCHGPVGLFDANKPDGIPLLANKQCTCFSDTEEIQVGQDANHRDQVGFLCEAKIKDLGGKFVSAEPWSAHCVTDGNLVTGMNPHSSLCTAEAFARLVPKV